MTIVARLDIVRQGRPAAGEPSPAQISSMRAEVTFVGSAHVNALSASDLIGRAPSPRQRAGDRSSSTRDALVVTQTKQESGKTGTRSSDSGLVPVRGQGQYASMALPARLPQ
jgi:hypothetical protein